ncbi:MAG: energy transducer TonB [Proteobacteria bacterium]|nr:energy transducer TonB [Pseudomonadota bacterium]
MRLERIEYDQPNLEEQISVPYIAPEPSTKIYNWAPPSTEATGGHAASNDYLAMVRLKIEQHKKYPPIARIKQKQGKVIIRFVITLEGTVRTMQIIKSSGHVSLDEAGLEAIRSSTPFPKPPAKLFKREIPIELPIIFELT